MAQGLYEVEYNGRVAFADSPVPERVTGYFECPAWSGQGPGSERCLVYDDAQPTEFTEEKPMYASMDDSGKTLSE